MLQKSTVVILLLFTVPCLVLASQPPNIVFVLADDLGYGDVGCYNPNSKIPTPNIDRLAENGLRYTNMHTTALCSPTRSCVLTGRNHHSNGVAAIM